MRITGYIEHPIFKITIFKMDNKFSVKFETGLFEQTYKFRTGDGIEKEQDIRDLVDATFIEEVSQHFQAMNTTRTNSLAKKMQGDALDEFEVII
jgi:hypothetical protein